MAVNNSPISQALTGDNLLLVINLKTIADDSIKYKMQFADFFQIVSQLASQGILTTGDYYVFKDKYSAIQKMITHTN